MQVNIAYSSSTSPLTLVELTEAFTTKSSVRGWAMGVESDKTVRSVLDHVKMVAVGHGVDWTNTPHEVECKIAIKGVGVLHYGRPHTIPVSWTIDVPVVCAYTDLWLCAVRLVKKGDPSTWLEAYLSYPTVASDTENPMNDEFLIPMGWGDEAHRRSLPMNRDGRLLCPVWFMHLI